MEDNPVNSDARFEEQLQTLLRTAELHNAELEKLRKRIIGVPQAHGFYENHAFLEGNGGLLVQ